MIQVPTWSSQNWILILIFLNFYVLIDEFLKYIEYRLTHQPSNSSELGPKVWWVYRCEESIPRLEVNSLDPAHEFKATNGRAGFQRQSH